MKNLRYIALLSVLILPLAACEATKDQLGLTRTAPDEYAVIKRAPLEMPPDFTLRPPRPGATRPQEMATEEQAKSAIFGDAGNAAARSTPDNGESALLMHAGADRAQPDIRQQVDYETSVLAPKEKPVAERILGWSVGGEDKPPATVVDAEAEAERLKKNAEEGKSVTEGETPQIEQ